MAITYPNLASYRIKVRYNKLTFLQKYSWILLGMHKEYINLYNFEMRNEIE